jgi:hypothetical protein
MRRALLLLLVALLSIGSLGVAAGPAAADAGQEQEFLRLLNETRAAHGLAPMILDGGLSVDARSWSAHMNARVLLYHTPAMQMRDEVARVVPAWQRIGENIGVGYDVQGLHNAFFNSTGHRANMLGDYNRLGVGVSRNGSQIWVTFRFVKGPAISGITGLEKQPNPDVTVCTGTIGARELIHVRVPRKSVCNLNGTLVTGNVKVAKGARLNTDSAIIRGDVLALRHRAVIVVDSRVRGVLQAKDGRRFTTKRTAVQGSVRALANRGTTSINKNKINGNLLCSTNAPAPAGGRNKVEGVKKDQCRRL